MTGNEETETGRKCPGKPTPSVFEESAQVGQSLGSRDFVKGFCWIERSCRRHRNWSMANWSLSKFSDDKLPRMTLREWMQPHFRKSQSSQVLVQDFKWRIEMRKWKSSAVVPYVDSVDVIKLWAQQKPKWLKKDCQKCWSLDTTLRLLLRHSGELIIRSSRWKILMCKLKEMNYESK